LKRFSIAAIRCFSAIAIGRKEVVSAVL
jgi:hypothetical protein